MQKIKKVSVKKERNKALKKPRQVAMSTAPKPIGWAGKVVLSLVGFMVLAGMFLQGMAQR